MTRPVDAAQPPLAPPREGELIGERDLAHWRTAAGRALARVVARLESRLGIAPAVASTLAVGIALTWAFAGLADGVYDAVVGKDGLSVLDRPALDAAIRLRSPGVDHAVTMLTDIGGPTWMPVFSLVLAGALAVTWRTWLPLLLAAVGAAGSLGLTVLGKDLVGRVRPPLADAVPPYEHSPSFPSGHTLNTTVVVGLLAYVALTRLRSGAARALVVALAVAWALAMGLSRVFLGHHWLTDVAMGWALGLTWVAAIVTVHRAWITARRHRAHRQTSTGAGPGTSAGATGASVSGSGPVTTRAHGATRRS